MTHAPQLHTFVRSIGLLLLWFPGATVADEPSKATSSHIVKVPGKTVRVGRPAPALSIEKLLQAPAGSAASWPALTGKCVVLEFWTTWCAPCVASIPHLNDLNAKFKDRAIVFIAVTDESEGKIRSFLKRRPISSWVGLDTDKSLFRGYQVKSIPHTVLVDAKGVVAAVTDPTSVTPDVIEALLAGRDLKLPVDDDDEEGSGVPQAVGHADEPQFQMIIRPSTEKMGRTSSGGGQLTMTGSQPVHIISDVYGFPAYQIDNKATLPNGSFDVIATMPDGQEEQLRPLLRRAMESKFRIKTRREKRQTDVFVLEKMKDRSPRLKASVMGDGGGASTSVSPGRAEMTNDSLAALAQGLGAQLKKPVIDESGLRGRYDVRLQWKPGDTDSLVQNMRETLGLELRPAKRPVEFLVIENDSMGAKGK